MGNCISYKKRTKKIDLKNSIIDIKNKNSNSCNASVSTDIIDSSVDVKNVDSDDINLNFQENNNLNQSPTKEKYENDCQSPFFIENQNYANNKQTEINNKLPDVINSTNNTNSNIQIPSIPISDYNKFKKQTNSNRSDLSSNRSDIDLNKKNSNNIQKPKMANLRLNVKLQLPLKTLRKLENIDYDNPSSRRSTHRHNPTPNTTFRDQLSELKIHTGRLIPDSYRSNIVNPNEKCKINRDILTPENDNEKLPENIKYKDILTNRSSSTIISDIDIDLTECLNISQSSDEISSNRLSRSSHDTIISAAISTMVGKISDVLMQKAIREKIENITNSYQSNINELNVYGGESCSICCENFIETDILKIMKCGHQQHEHCISKWAETKAVCPICNLDIIKEEY